VETQAIRAATPPSARRLVTAEVGTVFADSVGAFTQEVHVPEAPDGHYLLFEADGTDDDGGGRLLIGLVATGDLSTPCPLGDVPTVQMNQPVDGAVYDLGQEVNVDYSCELDGLPIECFASIASGDLLPTETPGSFEFTVTAMGPDGEAASTTATYTVAEPLGGECTITGTPGDDILTGTSGDDVICGEGGNDTIDAGEGRDIVYGGDGDDYVLGGTGEDILFGGPGDDELRGNEDNDVIFGEDGNDVLGGGMDADEIYGGNGADFVEGKRGDDTIYGGPGDDELRGNEDNDVIFGEDGNDVLGGGKGADLLQGGDGDDTLEGKNGDDALVGDAGSDSADGGAGTDSCDAETEVNCE
jgi:Ca2+-binding RTX toxin-like protein